MLLRNQSTGPVTGRRGGDVDEAEELADAFVTASRVLLGLAVHSVGAAPVEVTLLQHRVLVLLAARGEQSIREIAEELGVNPSNASRHCDRLQRLDLIARRRSSSDGRVVRVALTPAGKKVVDAVTADRRRQVLRVLGEMPPEGRESMLAALRAFGTAAHELADAEWVTNSW
jgi:DNA-binding MarR family transcriptional regulator